MVNGQVPQQFYIKNHENFILLQMQMRKYIYRTADSEHSFDLPGLISAVSVIDIYSRQYIPEKEFFACGL